MDPNLNPFLLNELERGKEAPPVFEERGAPARFNAGGQTVKAATGEAAWRAMRQWSYPMVLAPQLHTADEAVRLPTKDSTRPPPVRGLPFIGPGNPGMATDYYSYKIGEDAPPSPYNYKPERAAPRTQTWRYNYDRPYDFIYTGEHHLQAPQGAPDSEYAERCRMQ